ncbi:hypothetical protein D3C79_1043010 [compost metagenome]
MGDIVDGTDGLHHSDVSDDPGNQQNSRPTDLVDDRLLLLGREHGQDYRDRHGHQPDIELEH